MLVRRHVLFLAGLTVMLAAAPAAAQTSSEDERRSVELFEEARRLVAAANCPAATPKLHESLRLHPSIGAHLSLAQCYTLDDPASAWRELRVAERLAVEKKDDRAAYARSKAAALEPRLALVHVETSAPTFELLIDGTLTEVWGGDAIVSPPGEHRVEVRGTAVIATETKLVAATGSRVTLHVEARPVARAPEREGPPAGASQRQAALIVAGVGGAAVIFGTIAGAIAMGRKSDLETQCTGEGTPAGSRFPDNCGGGAFGQPRRDDIDDKLSSANSWATVSTVAFVIGGAAVAAGAVLYFTAPRAKTATARLQLGPGSAMLAGSF